MAEPDAIGIALRALSSHERTVGEMEGLLRERGIEEEEVAVTVARLIEDGALDDERFANRYAEDKREISGWGPERIRRTLVERGIDSELVERAVAAESHQDQVERAVGFLGEKGFELTDPGDQRRALGALARRGFDSEVAWEAIRTVERAQRPSGSNG